MLTQDQLKANIDAMQSQGASHDDIQGYLDSLKGQDNPISTPETQPSEGWGVGLLKGLGSVAKGATSLLTTNEQGTAKDIAAGFGQQQFTPQDASLNAKSVGQLIAHAHQLPIGDPRRTTLLQQAAQIAGIGSGQAQENLSNIPSNEHALGDVAGVGLDVLASGTYGKGGLVTGQLGKATPTALEGLNKGVGFLRGAGQGALQGAKTGGLIGAGYGAVHGLQADKSALGVAGSAVEGGVSGAAVGGIIGGITGGISGVRKSRALARFNNPENDASLNKIQDTISPKLNSKEIKLAVNEGRFVSGQDPGLLSGGTPDSVIPSDKTIQVAQTIRDNIPGADKMKAPELFKALNTQGVALRDQLTPVMEQTPVSPDTLDQINSSWEALKAKQADNPYLDNTLNLNKIQDNFEQKFLDPYLLGNTENANMNDLWQTTQAYDNSVPANVKNANALSSQALQNQKEIWLQNRSILANATHNVVTGLDETSRKAFSMMSDMYTAKENIISKITLNKAGELSFVKQWIKDNPWKALGIGAGVSTVTGANKYIGAAARSIFGL